MKRLILILGDQLNHSLSSIVYGNKRIDHVAMAELGDELTYTKHHRKKVVLIFSAMRHFFAELQDAGWKGFYQYFNPESEIKSFAQWVMYLHVHNHYDEVVVTYPGEYRVKEQLDGLASQLDVPLVLLPDDRFICSPEEFHQWADDRKTLRMEYFYRDMRRKTGLLMEEGEPVGGQWNFDKDNRKRFDGHSHPLPPLRHEPDDITKQVLELLDDPEIPAIGELNPFWFAVTHDQAEQSLEHFLEFSLPAFGDFQDAMSEHHDFLFHSVISMYINIGLLDTLYVCERAEQCYVQGHAPLNAVEGFIRQLIGWREFVRGFYWYAMPEYPHKNALHADNPLPEYFWTGKTKMRCMEKAIGSSLEHAYAHHIQRLMVTGNFALIAGLDPVEVCDWYLGIYADAFEWVELPNTLGMALHGDGGMFASKPYAASGKYIQKMSDHCASCPYNVKTAEQEDSCPFNALYWHFMYRHRERFQQHPRMGMIYRSFTRMDVVKQEAILQRGDQLLKRLNEL